jgi:hypothetical protein
MAIQGTGGNLRSVKFAQHGQPSNQVGIQTSECLNHGGAQPHQAVVGAYGPEKSDGNDDPDERRKNAPGLSSDRAGALQ